MLPDIEKGNVKVKEKEKRKSIGLKEKEKKKFQGFNETFPFCALGLACALVYPNKHNIRKRIVLGLIIVGINSVELLWFIHYLFKCLFALDVFNFTRNFTLAIIVTLFFFKTIYGNYKNDEFEKLLAKITSDLLKGNEMEEDYQDIYEYYIKEGRVGQFFWIVIPILLSTQFPIYAAVCMIYENLKSDMGKKYMLHEMDLKFIEHIQYESPYFEIIFAYNLLQCIILVPIYCGFDGSFCIATSHLCLKLKLMTHKMHRIFADSKNITELKMKLNETLLEHQEALQFHNDIQKMYGLWLLAVFFLSSFLISFNVYQLYLSKRLDPKYAMFGITGVVHIFTPCHFAACLIKVGDEVPTDLYSCGWEKWADPSVTKTLIFMIAKSQQQLLLTGKGMVVFNMEVFLSILQTSYSFFTLITTGK